MAFIEACVDSYASAKAAFCGGADRFELCGQLSIGGVTPSPALFEQIRRDFDLPIRVLIRPRGGDFLYSKEEAEQILREISLFRSLGADGVVIGALNREGDLDLSQMQSFLNCAEGMKVTLHRAFDVCRDAFSTLEQAKELFIDTILTSGQRKTAILGIELLKELRRAAGKVKIMAGGGVRADNIQVLKDAGIEWLHTSCRREIKSGMRFFNGEVCMGFAGIPEDSRFVTDEEEFRSCAKKAHN